MGSARQFRSLNLFLGLLVSMVACGGDDQSTESDWETLLDSAYDQAVDHIDDIDALQAELSSLESPADRDMVLYRLAFNHPEMAANFCAHITTPSFVEKCQQVLGRPHLGSIRRAKTNPSDPPPAP